MVLLDMRNYWLPLRYTSGFWLTGLLFTFLPGSTITLTEALTGSIGMFMFLYAFHYGAKRLRGVCVNSITVSFRFCGEWTA